MAIQYRETLVTIPVVSVYVKAINIVVVTKNSIKTSASKTGYIQVT